MTHVNKKRRRKIMADKSGISVFAKAGKYLTFKLGTEEYGLEILKVREIIGLMNITAVPRSPDYVRGVINLRGTIIPVVDLRKKFGMESTEETEQSCIIVVEVTKEDGSEAIGVFVDAVSEVLDIAESNIERAPSLGAGVNTDFILGMAKIKDSVKILLNVEEVLTNNELIEISKVAVQPDSDIQK
jgi:purine-binding chemotaxis protein CheW